MKKTKLLTGKNISMMDIIIYSELQTIFKLYGLDIDHSEYEHLSTWLDLIESQEVSRILIMHELNEKLE